MKHLLFFACLIAQFLNAQEIQRDLSFGNDGELFLNGFSINEKNLITVDDSGYILLSESLDNYHSLKLTRYTPDGNIDQDFGSGGSILHTFNGNPIYIWSNPVFQSDGKILLTGATSLSEYINVMTVWRFKSNGELDLTFNGQGYYQFIVPYSHQNSSGTKIALQSDGKIVIAGGGLNLLYGGYAYSNSFSGGDLTVWRLLSDGSLDQSFNGIGYKCFDSNSSHFPQGNPSNSYSEEIVGDLKIRDNNEIIVGTYDISVPFNNKKLMYYVFSPEGQYILPVQITSSYQDLNQIKDVLTKQNDIYFTTSLVNGNGDFFSYVDKYDSYNQQVFSINNYDLGLDLTYTSRFSINSIVFYQNGLVGVGKYYGSSDFYNRLVLFKLNSDGTPEYNFHNGNSYFTEYIPNLLGVIRIYNQDGKLLVLTKIPNSFMLTRYSQTGNVNTTEQNELNFKCYPNPTKDIIYFERKLNNVKVYDASGQMINFLNSETNHIDLKNLKPGTYFLEGILKNGKQIKTQVLKL